MKILPFATRGAIVIEYDTESAGTVITDHSSLPLAASSACNLPSMTGTMTLRSYNATPRLLTLDEVLDLRFQPAPSLEAPERRRA